MSEEKLREELWNKVNTKFEEYKKQQLTKSKEEIFNNSFEIAHYQEFVDMCDPSLERFRIDAVKALLKEDNPAYTLYNYYMKSECESYDDLYLDITYMNNEINILDEDELIEAYKSNDITKEDLDLVYKIKDKLINEIKSNTNKLMNINFNKYLNNF